MQNEIVTYEIEASYFGNSRDNEFVQFYDKNDGVIASFQRYSVESIIRDDANVTQV